MDEFDLHLLLDQAANRFEPRPDLGRLDALLRGRRWLRGAAVAGLSVAAAGLVLAGTALALTSAVGADGVRPAGDHIEIGGPQEPRATWPEDRSAAREHVAEPGDGVPPVRTTATPAPLLVAGEQDVTAAVPVEREPQGRSSPTVPSPPAPAPQPASTSPGAGLDAPLSPSPTSPVTAPATSPVSVAPTPDPAPGTPPPDAPGSSTSAPTTTPATTSPPTTAAPTTSTPPSVSLSAHQRWGHCDLDPPYDEFWGTAAPGAVVSITSAYGSGQTTADAGGHWELTVFFPSAPVGEWFPVTVTSSQGGSVQLGFTRTG